MPNQHPPEAPQIQINPNDLADVVCDMCGGNLFDEIYILKRISALQSPTGKSGLIPVGPLFACHLCGHINEELLPAQLRGPTPSTKTEDTESMSQPEKTTLSLLKE